MNTTDGANTGRPVEDLASQYVSGVRGLFAAPAAPRAERGGRGPAAAPEVADRATTLSPVSADLTRALSAQLGAQDTGVREQSATKLLAKALTDLQVSQHLYTLASDEEEGSTRGLGGQSERASVASAVDEGALELLLMPASAPRPAVPERGGQRGISNIDTARVELSTAAQDTLAAISDKAAKTGQSALAGLLGLGVADLAKAAGIVGMDIAGVLGQSNKVSKLYELCRGFLSNAYNSLLALIGQSVAQTAAKQVLDWVDKLKSGALFGDLLEKAYDTGEIGKEVNALVVKSQASPDNFTATIDKVKALGDGYARQTSIAGKVLTGARFVGTLPLAVLPQGKIVLAAAYIILGSYIVLAGADYVDARHLQLLNRVPGVEEVIKSGLSG